MNDFLHSLRTGHYQRYRKPYNGNNHTNGNYNGNDYGNQKKTNQHTKNEGTEQLVSLLKDMAPLVASFVKNDFLERKIITEERKAEAMETIAAALSKLAGLAPEAKSKGTPTIIPKNNADESENDNDGADFHIRDKAVTTIKKLRVSGMSYEQIAQHLEMEKIPTLSGRGKWHAPTVSSLLKNAA